MGQQTDDLLTTVTRFPNVISAPEEELGEDEWKGVKDCIQTAVDKLDEFRRNEGNSLAKDLEARVASIRKLSDGIRELEPERSQMIKDRLNRKIEEHSEPEQRDQNRLEQEMIYYLEKLDVNEELVRLESHCGYYLETMQGNENGKKLGFISQEMGREINTLGSKAQHAGIQKLVVQMKDELEKIKEQVLNVI